MSEMQPIIRRRPDQGTTSNPSRDNAVPETVICQLGPECKHTAPSQCKQYNSEAAHRRECKQDPCEHFDTPERGIPKYARYRGGAQLPHELREIAKKG